jgi:hypothetical protein
MTDLDFSPLAHRATALKSEGARAKVFGLMVHTSGRSIVTDAIKHDANPLEYVVAYYTKPKTYCPGYVMGWDGDLWQIAKDMSVTYHVGVKDFQRAAFLNGSWKTKVSKITLSQWTRKWPGVKGPAYLYPSRSPNWDYIGVEMLPIVTGCGAPPAFSGALFTQAQHSMVADLWTDIAKRHGIVNALQPGRLVGHEDINPWPSTLDNYGRSDTGGGWDPGDLRDQPYFRWDHV